MPATQFQASGQDAAITPALAGAPTAAPTGAPPLGAPSDHEPRTLFVAATGGHLMQLTRLAPRIVTLGRPLWVTFDSPQSRSLLAGEEVLFVTTTKPRDLRNVIGNLPAARRILSERNIVEVGVDRIGRRLSFLPLARLRGLPCHYIESAARSDGPFDHRPGASVRGRDAALHAVPAVGIAARWSIAGSVFDEFAACEPLDPVNRRELRCSSRSAR